MSHRFGRWTLIERLEPGDAPAAIRARCDCGARVTFSPLVWRAIRRSTARAASGCGSCTMRDIESELRRCAFCGGPCDPDRRQAHGKVTCSVDCSRALKKVRENRLTEEWRQRHHARSLEYAAAYRARNREKLKIKGIDYYWRNRKRILLDHKRRYWQAKEPV